MSENMKPVCEEKGPLTDELLRKMNAYWRATNYLAAGQLYLLDNPLLREPLTMEQIKKKIVGHWGTVPGQNFVYVHLNRVIKRYDLDMILLMTVNPGFGGQSYIPAMTEKIRTLRHILEEKGLQTDIEIDGGVDTKNLRMVIEAGANVLVSGSKIFGGDIAENVHQFKAIMAEYTK